MSTILTLAYLKNAPATLNFFWKLLASVGFFPFDYNTKSEKEDKSKKKIWWIKLQMIDVYLFK